MNDIFYFFILFSKYKHEMKIQKINNFKLQNLKNHIYLFINIYNFKLQFQTLYILASIGTYIINIHN